MKERSLKNSLKRLGVIALAFIITAANIFPGIARADSIKGVNPKFIVTANKITNKVEGSKYFTDVENTHWGIEAIKWGVDEGIVVGYIDGTFRPEEQLNEAEFATILARYVENTDKEKISKNGENHWADYVYDELGNWDLPFGGYQNTKVRDTGITRGKIAQIVAAKYGFNLTERQAVYFMYENDLSYGMIPNQMTFESYKVGDTLNRVMAVEFMRKLNEQGHVEFMGKPAKDMSNTGIVGIKDVPQEEVEITDEMFDELAKKKGIENPVKTGSKVGWVDEVANKYGLKVEDDAYDEYGVFSLKNKDKKSILTYALYENKRSFEVRTNNYGKNEQIALETIEATGKVKIEEIKEAIEKHFKYIGPPQYWPITGGQTEITGTYEDGGHMTIRIYIFEK